MTTDRISPTAHYTGYVWTRNGLSVDGLRTLHGAVAYHALRPLQSLGARGYGGNSLEALLLQRHALLDRRLHAAIRERGVRGVLEIAGGLSARGLRFATGYPELRYVEGDLPDMASRKRRMLRSAPPLRNHTVVALDALADEGAGTVGSTLRNELGGASCAVITEGLLNYFDEDAVRGLWKRIATALRANGGGVYLADLHVRDETIPYPSARIFLDFLACVARGDMHIHFDDAPAAAEALREAGFDEVTLRRPRLEGIGKGRGRDVVRIVEAWVRP